MEKRTDTKIPYGVADFKRIRNEGYYYVDKTEYLAKLEERDSFVFFVRPRRMGKSLFLDMLRLYYDRNERENFERLFGGLWIGSHPTPNRNRYLTLALDFSQAGPTGGRSLQECFEAYLTACFQCFVAAYPEVYDADFRRASENKPALDLFVLMTKRAKAKGFPIYLIIDEYDNFTNALIRSSGNESYRSITHGTGFYREWFKKFKGSVDRIFMTGVSPVTMDDLTSGFNIAANISQDEDFNSMLGFSFAETLQMYRDFKGVGKYQSGDPEAIVRSIKPWYDGYCFAEEKIGEESVFNSDMVLYHLKSMVAKGRPPKDMVDANIATDYDKLETIVDLQRQAGAQGVLPSVASIIENRGLCGSVYDSFDIDKFGEAKFLLSNLFYYGVITLDRKERGEYYYRIPNAMSALAFIRLLNGHRGKLHSYIVELKYSKPDASDADLAVKAEDGIRKLRQYAADPFVPELAKDTTLHLILYQFKGTELVRCEEIAQ